MIHTQLCDLLAIEHPILNAPMGGTATADLAAAVSMAGGFGMIGGTSPGGADWLRAQIQYLAAVPDLALTMDLAFAAFPFPITPTDTPERLHDALTGLVSIYA